MKKVLMDQRAVVGIGNIYANEALWRARHRPVARRANTDPPESRRRFTRSIVDVLTESIAAARDELPRLSRR